MYIIKKRIMTFLVMFLVFSMMAACGSITTGSSNNASGNSNSNISLTFATSSDSANASISTLVTPNDYCREFGNFQTQQCNASPLGYDLGILAIYLVDCADNAGNSVACRDESMSQVKSRFELYNGSQIDVNVDDIGTEFSGELAALSEDFTVGGIQIVTAYIQQTFQESGTTEGDKIMSDLQGATYRICLSSELEIDEDTMETRCGLADAEKGDYLVDLDGDGVFGYMDNISDIEDSMTEATTRPEGYDTYNDQHFVDNMVCFLPNMQDCAFEYTDEVFYPVKDYFAPILPLANALEMAVDETYNLVVEFDIENTFSWTDGADAELPDEDTCVQGVTDEVCEEDADPESVGVYNVFYDTAFLPETPQVSVTVE